jgi:hypothetical protein
VAIVLGFDRGERKAIGEADRMMVDIDTTATVRTPSVPALALGRPTFAGQAAVGGVHQPEDLLEPCHRGVP